MTKDQQDRAWACLPKEARAKTRIDYDPKSDYQDEGYNLALRSYFGHHNLSSDTEPEEMLVVERKKVIKLIQSLKTIDDYTNGIHYCAKSFFGDKCLPDKDPATKS